MPKKRFSAEQIVTLLRQIEVAMGQGKSIQIACRDAGISEQTYVMSCSTARSSTA
jgi:putative transposase